MVKIYKYITHHYPIVILLIISSLLCFLNYKPGTWLLGWDNLSPEFNFELDFKRNLFSAWQEYRSLGLLGGMAHAADLPRQLFLWLSSILLPTSFLRYFWTFICLVLGPLGAYFLAQTTLFSRLGPSTRRFLAFFAGLFYLLNLATIQNFYTPFDTFSTFYAALPWLLYTSLLYLKHPTRKSFFILALSYLLSAPAFYVQTLFIVFILSLLPFIIALFKTHSRFTSSFILTLTLLISQAYWLLPVAYFTLTGSQVTINALQNQIATREMISRNQQYGNPQDVFLLKGFNFSYVDLGPNNRFDYLMRPWLDHYSPLLSSLGHLFLAITFLGIIYSFSKRLPFRWPTLTLFLTSLFFLINLNPPTAPLFAALSKLPLVSQIFRNVYTKWSLPAALTYSLFFAAGCYWLYQHLFLKLSRHLAPPLLISSLTFLLIVYLAPAFQGNLIYPSMRVKLPNEYLQLFDYMRTQDPNTRIANFPQNTFWGWQFYSWGYRGSGFLWYGLPQSILDRAFDVWSKPSEDYFEDVKNAIYSQDKDRLANVLNKYSVNWILLDNNIIFPASDSQVGLYLPQITTMLNSLPQVKLEKRFNTLSLYRFTPDSSPSSYIATHPLPLYTTSSPQPSGKPIFTDTSLQNHSGLDKPKNCDAFNSGYFDRKLTPDSITYSAIGALSCDAFLFPSLPHSQGYRFSITHRNLTGLPLQICLESYVSKHCLATQYLPTSPNWTTSTLDLPPLHPTDYGYTLHLLNYSIGKTLTANELKSIQVIPLTYPQPQKTTLSVPTIHSVSHPNPAIYKISLTSKTGDHLVLAQAYHPLWIAFLLPSTASQALSTSLLDYRLSSSNHTQLNSWANSWTLPQGDYTVYIFFLPQLFQFLGFVLLLSLPLLLFLHSLHLEK